MKNLFELIALTVMITLAWKVVTSEGMLLEKLGFWIRFQVDKGRKIFDLLFCPFCTTFFAMVAFGFSFGLEILSWELSLKNVLLFPLTVCGSSFISGNMWSFYEAINRVRERNEEEYFYYRNLNEGIEKIQQESSDN